MEWRQKVSQRLRSLERRSVGTGSFQYETVIVHPSPLVRALANDDSMLSYDGIDIFIEEFLSKRDDAKGLEFGHRRERLGDAVARETERRGSGSDDDDPAADH